MTTIILNTEAVQALFPEGSEARVKLQDTVLRKIAEQHLKNAGIGDLAPQLRTELNRALEELQRARSRAINEALNGQGFRTDWGVQLNVETKAAITSAVKEAVGAQISAAIRERVDAQLEKISGTIAHDVQAAVNRATEAEVTRVVRERIQSVVEKLGAP